MFKVYVKKKAQILHEIESEKPSFFKSKHGGDLRFIYNDRNISRLIVKQIKQSII